MESQFFYYLLVWYFCARTSANMINKLQERSLRIIPNDYSSDFNMLRENSNDICNHSGYIQVLLNKVFKLINELVPPITKPILNERFNTYNLKNFQYFATERKRILWCGLKITIILNSDAFCQKVSKKWIL